MGSGHLTSYMSQGWALNRAYANNILWGVKHRGCLLISWETFNKTSKQSWVLFGLHNLCEDSFLALILARCTVKCTFPSIPFGCLDLQLEHINLDPNFCSESCLGLQFFWRVKHILRVRNRPMFHCCFSKQASSKEWQIKERRGRRAWKIVQSQLNKFMPPLQCTGSTAVL